MNLENTWTWSDIAQLAAGFILFLVGIWIGKKQEKSVNLTKDITKEIKYLQTGIAELQMYEKIGVIGWGLNRASQGEASVAPALLYDCLAVLPILEFSGETLANNYVDLLRQSLDSLTEYSLGNKSMSAILIEYSLIQIESLERKGRKDLAEEITNALARYWDVLKSKNQQKAEEVFSPFLQSEQVKQLLNVPSGDTYRIMKLLGSNRKS